MATTHGKSRTKLYKHWARMKSRCYDPNHKDYYHWGGSGITVCKEWEESFEAFEKWALEAGYRESEYCTLVIHRTDSSKKYDPDNCEWVEPEEHAFMHHSSEDTVDAMTRNTHNFHYSPNLFEQSAFNGNTRRSSRKSKTRVK